MLGIEYILASIIISKWFSILREPGQLLSWYNRMLIGWDEDQKIEYFEIESNYNFFQVMIVYFINFLKFFYNNFKPFIYKVLTCSLCHSGYLAIYFIFAYKQHFIILPTTMVFYYLLSKIKF